MAAKAKRSTSKAKTRATPSYSKNVVALTEVFTLLALVFLIATLIYY